MYVPMRDEESPCSVQMERYSTRISWCVTGGSMLPVAVFLSSTYFTPCIRWICSMDCFIKFVWNRSHLCEGQRVIKLRVN
jgi:hypothetical protein